MIEGDVLSETARILVFFSFATRTHTAGQRIHDPQKERQLEGLGEPPLKF